MYFFYDHPINLEQPPALRFARAGPGKRFFDIVHTRKYKRDQGNITGMISEEKIKLL